MDFRNYPINDQLKIVIKFRGVYYFNRPFFVLCVSTQAIAPLPCWSTTEQMFVLPDQIPD